MPKTKTSRSKPTALPYLKAKQAVKFALIEALNETGTTVVKSKLERPTLRSQTEQMVIEAMKAGHWHVAVRYLQTAKCLVSVRPTKVNESIKAHKYTPPHFPVHDIIRYVQWLEHLMGIKA